LRGRPGTKVTVTIVREGWTEPKDFEITREQIRVHSVRSQDLGNGIAYIKLRQFQEQSHTTSTRRSTSSTRAG